jgi:hypothetical protein
VSVSHGLQLMISDTQCTRGLFCACCSVWCGGRSCDTCAHAHVRTMVSCSCACVLQAQVVLTRVCCIYVIERMYVCVRGHTCLHVEVFLWLRMPMCEFPCVMLSESQLQLGVDESS